MHKLRKITAAIGVALFAMLVAAPAQATSTDKVFVCKYVGTPGINEVLQSGNNPIDVAQSSLGAGFTGSLPYWFNDAQGRSVAFAFDTTKGGGQEGEPALSDCPTPPGPPADEVVTGEWTGEWECDDTTVHETQTVTTTPYKWHNGQWVLDTANAEVTQNERDRALTQEEMYACEEPPGFVIVAWQMPTWEGNSNTSWPQTYVTHQAQAAPNLAQLDSYLDSNFEYGCFQIDIYYDSETTTSLINGGFLTAPNNPAEDLIPGGWGTAYKVYAVGGPFAVGSACAPPPPVECVNIDMTVDDALEAGYTVDENNNCYPPVDPVCENIEMTLEQARALGYTIDENNNCEEKKVEICHHDQGSPVYKVIEIAESAVPAHMAHQWGLDYLVSELPEGWTIEGDDCVPPPVECANIDMTVDDALEAGYYVDEENNCFADVQVCAGAPNYGAIWVGYDEYIDPENDYEIYNSETCKPPAAPTPPTLTGEIVAQCIADYPWINYEVTLVDPDGQVNPEASQKVTFTFSNPSNAAQFITVERTLTGGQASGMFPWFGADANDDGTPDGWPGWVPDGLGGFESDLTQNFGWTRNGLNVLAEVNPSFTVNGLAYPSATDPCEPELAESTLGAPPATPVTAEAQYAG